MHIKREHNENKTNKMRTKTHKMRTKTNKTRTKLINREQN